MGTLRTAADSVQFSPVAMVPHGRATDGLNPFLGPNRWLSGIANINVGATANIVVPTAATRALRVGKIVLSSATLINIGGIYIQFSGAPTVLHVWWPVIGSVWELNYLPCGISSPLINQNLQLMNAAGSPAAATISWFVLYAEEYLAGQVDGEN